MSARRASASRSRGPGSSASPPASPPTPRSPRTSPRARRAGSASTRSRAMSSRCRRSPCPRPRCRRARVVVARLVPAMALAAARSSCWSSAWPRPRRPASASDVASVKGIGDVVLGRRARARRRRSARTSATFAPGDRWKVVVTCAPEPGGRRRWVEVVVVEVGASAARSSAAPARLACGNRIVVARRVRRSPARARTGCACGSRPSPAVRGITGTGAPDARHRVRDRHARATVARSARAERREPGRRRSRRARRRRTRTGRAATRRRAASPSSRSECSGAMPRARCTR